MFENSAQRSYSCLMLDLGFLIEDFRKLQEQICPCELYDEPGYGMEKEPHITIKYGIHEEEPRKIFSELELKPIRFKLAGLSSFKSNDYDVLKFTVVSDDLMKLNKQVCEKFTYTDTFPNYIPHATIAYLKKGNFKYYKNLKSKLFNKPFTSNKFIFSNPLSEKVVVTK